MCGVARSRFQALSSAGVHRVEAGHEFGNREPGQMSCLNPTVRYPPKENASSGRYTRDPARAGGPPVETACGQCPPCRKRLVAEWATRMLHEAKTSAAGQCYFVTCTISPDAMRKRGTFSLSMKEHQDFVKRVRNAFGPHIRYGMAAEYGSMDAGHTGRPHYHYCFFNLPLDDLVSAAPSKSGLPQWHSAKLTEAWEQGLVWVGTVTRQSCEYVAGYIMKRSTGQNAQLVIRHWVDDVTGEIREDVCRSEFGSASRGGRGADGVQLGGLGSEWLRHYGMDCFPSDFLIDRKTGNKIAVPRAYRRKLPEAERLAAGERAMQRAKEREQREIDIHRPPPPLRYPDLLDEGQRILLRRDVRRGEMANATEHDRQVAEGAARVLEMVEERIVLSDEPAYQVYKYGGYRRERVPSAAEQRDAAIAVERRAVSGRILSINLDRKKREL